MYKKIVVLALACVTAATLVACGGNAASSSAASSSSSSDSTASVAASSSATSSASASSSAASADFQKGSVSGDTYTSEYFGVKFTLPGDWAFATDSELAEINGKAASTINNQQVLDMLESGQAFIDMFSRKSDKLANVNLSYEKFDSSSISLTAKDVLKNSSGMAKQELESQGFSNVKLEDSTTDFCGESVPCVNFVYDIDGVPVYQRLVAMVKGDYIMSVSATTAKEDTCADVLGQFEAI